MDWQWVRRAVLGVQGHIVRRGNTWRVHVYLDAAIVSRSADAEPAVAKASPRFAFAVQPHATEAVQTPARVKVTCVTPLGEEVVSTW